ncbi:TIGR00725 family protein [bacterium]|nr:TIGR00725 family protein [bacterium]
MRRTIIGVMGGSAADARTADLAYEMGRQIAEHGWVMLCGGRPTGVMDASARGCRDAGGLSVGVLFDGEREAASEHLDLVLPTAMGAARNIINVLSSDVVVACRGAGGTLSEIALALRFERPVILLDFDPGVTFLEACGPGPWFLVGSAEEAAQRIAHLLEEMGRS